LLLITKRSDGRFIKMTDRAYRDAAMLFCTRGYFCMAQQWEYHVEMITATSPTAAIPAIEKKLNALGADGWEAITNVTGQVGIYLLFKQISVNVRAAMIL